MLDSRMLIGSRNRLDEATLSGGDWSDGLPLSNLKQREIAKVARSKTTSTASTTFTMDFGRPRPLRLVGLIAHNASLSAMMRVEISEVSNFATRFYDETVEIWGGLLTGPWNIDTLEWEDDNFWLGGLDSEDVQGLTAQSFHVLPDPKVGQYLRITILDQANTAGYFQLGRAFAGPAIQPRINRAWGGSLGMEFGTAIETALGGAEFFDVREGVRIFRFSLQHMANDEAFGIIMKMIRERGLHGEVVVIPDPTDQSQGYLRNFLGRIRQPSALEEVQWRMGGDSHSVSLEIKELR